MTRKIALVAVVAMVVMGTSVVLALGAGPHARTDVATQETTTTPVGTTTEVTANANITISNQTSNGTAVVIERVVVPKGGFVGVYAAANVTDETTTATGTTTAIETFVPGGVATQEYVADELLGNSTYLEPGTHRNVTVQLNRTLNESQVLVAMPHRDANGNQQFDFSGPDEPYGQPAPLSDWAFVTIGAGANQTTTAAGTATTTTATTTTTTTTEGS